MQSLITDPGVAKYRQYEIEQGAKVVEELLRGDFDPQYVKGALFMLKKLLQSPLKYAKSKETKDLAQMMIKRDLKEFQSKFMRLFLE